MNDTTDDSLEVLFHLPQYLFNLLDPTIKFRKLQSCLNKNSGKNDDSIDNLKDQSYLRKIYIKKIDIDEHDLKQRLSDNFEQITDGKNIVPLKRKLTNINDETKFSSNVSLNESYQKSHFLESKIPIKQRKVAEIKLNKDILFTRVWREAIKLEQEVKHALNETNNLPSELNASNKKNLTMNNYISNIDSNNKIQKTLNHITRNNDQNISKSDNYNSNNIASENIFKNKKDVKHVDYQEDTFEEKNSEIKKPVKNNTCIGKVKFKPIDKKSIKKEIAHNILIKTPCSNLYNVKEARIFMRRKRKEQLLMKKQMANEIDLSKKHTEDKLHLLALKQKEVVAQARKRPVPILDDDSSIQTVIRNGNSINGNLTMNKKYTNNIISNKRPQIYNLNEINCDNNQNILKSIKKVKNLKQPDKATLTCNINSESSVNVLNFSTVGNNEIKVNGLIEDNKTQFINTPVVKNNLLPRNLKIPKVDNIDEMTSEEIVKLIANYNGISVQDICSNFQKYSSEIQAFVSKEKSKNITKISQIKNLADNLILRCASFTPTFNNYNEDCDYNGLKYKDDDKENYQDDSIFINLLKDKELPGTNLSTYFTPIKDQNKNVDTNILQTNIGITNSSNISEPKIMNTKIISKEKIFLKKEYISKDLIKCPFYKNPSLLLPSYNLNESLRLKFDKNVCEKLDPIQNMHPDPDNIVNIMHKRKMALSLASINSKDNENNVKIKIQNNDSKDSENSIITEKDYYNSESKIKSVVNVLQTINSQEIVNANINADNIEIFDLNDHFVNLNSVINLQESENNENNDPNLIDEIVESDVEASMDVTQSRSKDSNNIKVDSIQIIKSDGVFTEVTNDDERKDQSDFESVDEDLEPVVVNSAIVEDGINLSLTINDNSISNEIETLSLSGEKSNHSEVSHVYKNPLEEIFDKIIYPLNVKASPAELEARMMAELALLENMDISSQQLTQLASTNEIAVCRSEVVTMGQILMRKETEYDLELKASLIKQEAQHNNHLVRMRLQVDEEVKQRRLEADTELAQRQGEENSLQNIVKIIAESQINVAEHLAEASKLSKQNEKNLSMQETISANILKVFKKQSKSEFKKHISKSSSMVSSSSQSEASKSESQPLLYRNKVELKNSDNESATEKIIKNVRPRIISSKSLNSSSESLREVGVKQTLELATSSSVSSRSNSVVIETASDLHESIDSVKSIREQIMDASQLTISENNSSGKTISGVNKSASYLNESIDATKSIREQIMDASQLSSSKSISSAKSIREQIMDTFQPGSGHSTKSVNKTSAVVTASVSYSEDSDFGTISDNIAMEVASDKDKSLKYEAETGSDLSIKDEAIIHAENNDSNKSIIEKSIEDDISVQFSKKSDNYLNESINDEASTVSSSRTIPKIVEEEALIDKDSDEAASNDIDDDENLVANNVEIGYEESGSDSSIKSELEIKSNRIQNESSNMTDDSNDVELIRVKTAVGNLDVPKLKKDGVQKRKAAKTLVKKLELLKNKDDSQFENEYSKDDEHSKLDTILTTNTESKASVSINTDAEKSLNNFYFLMMQLQLKEDASRQENKIGMLRHQKLALKKNLKAKLALLEHKIKEGEKEKADHNEDNKYEEKHPHLLEKKNFFIQDYKNQLADINILEKGMKRSSEIQNILVMQSKEIKNIYSVTDKLQKDLIKKNIDVEQMTSPDVSLFEKSISESSTSPHDKLIKKMLHKKYLTKKEKELHYGMKLKISKDSESSKSDMSEASPRNKSLRIPSMTSFHAPSRRPSLVPSNDPPSRRASLAAITKEDKSVDSKEDCLSSSAEEISEDVNSDGIPQPNITDSNSDKSGPNYSTVFESYADVPTTGRRNSLIPTPRVVIPDVRPSVETLSSSRRVSVDETSLLKSPKLIKKVKKKDLVETNEVESEIEKRVKKLEREVENKKREFEKLKESKKRQLLIEKERKLLDQLEDFNKKLENLKKPIGEENHTEMYKSSKVNIKHLSKHSKRRRSPEDSVDSIKESLKSDIEEPAISPDASRRGSTGSSVPLLDLKCLEQSQQVKIVPDSARTLQDIPEEFLSDSEVSASHLTTDRQQSQTQIGNSEDQSHQTIIEIEKGGEGNFNDPMMDDDQDIVQALDQDKNFKLNESFNNDVANEMTQVLDSNKEIISHRVFNKIKSESYSENSFDCDEDKYDDDSKQENTKSSKNSSKQNSEISEEINEVILSNPVSNEGSSSEKALFEIVDTIDAEINQASEKNKADNNLNNLKESISDNDNLEPKEFISDNDNMKPKESISDKDNLEPIKENEGIVENNNVLIAGDNNSVKSDIDLMKSSSSKIGSVDINESLVGSPDKELSKNGEPNDNYYIQPVSEFSNKDDPEKIIDNFVKKDINNYDQISDTLVEVSNETFDNLVTLAKNINLQEEILELHRDENSRQEKSTVISEIKDEERSDSYNDSDSGENNRLEVVDTDIFLPENEELYEDIQESEKISNELIETKSNYKSIHVSENENIESCSPGDSNKKLDEDEDISVYESITLFKDVDQRNEIVSKDVIKESDNKSSTENIFNRDTIVITDIDKNNSDFEKNSSRKDDIQTSKSIDEDILGSGDIELDSKVNNEKLNMDSAQNSERTNEPDFLIGFDDLTPISKDKILIPEKKNSKLHPRNEDPIHISDNMEDLLLSPAVDMFQVSVDKKKFDEEIFTNKQKDLNIADKIMDPWFVILVKEAIEDVMKIKHNKIFVQNIHKINEHNDPDYKKTVILADKSISNDIVIIGTSVSEDLDQKDNSKSIYALVKDLTSENNKLTTSKDLLEITSAKIFKETSRTVVDNRNISRETTPSNEDVWRNIRRSFNTDDDYSSSSASSDHRTGDFIFNRNDVNKWISETIQTIKEGKATNKTHSPKKNHIEMMVVDLSKEILSQIIKKQQECPSWLIAHDTEFDYDVAKINKFNDLKILQEVMARVFRFMNTKEAENIGRSSTQFSRQRIKGRTQIENIIQLDLKDEEKYWLDYTRDEYDVKILLSDSILDSLLVNTLAAVKSAIDAKLITK